jgi:mono/diheme cytochrome c family protein
MAILTRQPGRSVPGALILFACGELLSVGCSPKVLGDRPSELQATFGANDGGVASCNAGAVVSSNLIGGGDSAPLLGPTPVTAADPPPPISGGTLMVLHDGRTAVASDPDRDQIWIADLPTKTLRASVALAAHDEPGRLVEDAAGRVHVALRRGGALVTIDPQMGTLLYRRPVCAVPRGVAYDPSRDLVYVACMGGELVSLPAADGPVARTLPLVQDLRDVVLDGDNLLVSRFRTADVLVVDAASGSVGSTIHLPAFDNTLARLGATFTASTAWRMLAAPGGGAVMLHQRGVSGAIVAGPGGYGSSAPGSCDSIVHAAMTPINVGQACPPTLPIVGMVLAVDFGLSSDGVRTAVIAAGNAQNGSLPRLFVASTEAMTAAVSTTSICTGDGVHAPLPIGVPGGPTLGVDSGAPVPEADPPDFGGSPLMRLTDAGGSNQTGPGLPQPPQPSGEVEAVAFDGNDRVVVQTREPATLQMPELGVTIALSSVSRFDTGHAIFHANSGAGIACASCHAEGHEDGRTWQFDCLGPRRTMSISGGISMRTPYHWTGDLPDFPSLMQEVYVGRMLGTTFDTALVNATLQWIDSIPRLPPVVGDTASVARGRSLFNDSTHGCVSCHNGPNMSNNTIRDVGTGGMFKVPALTGVAWQAPYLHDGCAATLADRFGSCGGGDQHGVTSNLSSPQTADLIAYLQSL